MAETDKNLTQTPMPGYLGTLWHTEALHITAFYTIVIFTITAEILVLSLANFYRQ